MVLSAIISATICLCALLGYRVFAALWRAANTPLRFLPGPPNLKLYALKPSPLTEGENFEQWTATYGPTIAYRGVFGVRALFCFLQCSVKLTYTRYGVSGLRTQGANCRCLCKICADSPMTFRALTHILKRTDIYQRPPQARYQLSRIVGSGVLVTEGQSTRLTMAASGSSSHTQVNSTVSRYADLVLYNVRPLLILIPATRGVL